MNYVRKWWKEGDGNWLDALAQQMRQEPAPGPSRPIDDGLQSTAIEPLAVQLSSAELVKMLPAGTDTQAAIEEVAPDPLPVGRLALMAVEGRHGPVAAHYFIESIYDWLGFSHVVTTPAKVKKAAELETINSRD